MFGWRRGGGGAPEWLIVGLGNPGRQYAETRHNAGFRCLDVLAGRMDVKVDRLKFRSLTGDGELAGHRCLLLKPQTMMNASGTAVRQAADFYKIPPERVLVIFDDVSLAPGVLRVRREGSAGGHNGVKSLIDWLESDRFPRIKLGVGQKPRPEYDLADWVLAVMTPAERRLLDERQPDACEAAALIVGGRIDEAMNRYSR